MCYIALKILSIDIICIIMFKSKYSAVIIYEFKCICSVALLYQSSVCIIIILFISRRRPFSICIITECNIIVFLQPCSVFPFKRLSFIICRRPVSVIFYCCSIIGYQLIPAVCIFYSWGEYRFWLFFLSCVRRCLSHHSFYVLLNSSYILPHFLTFCQ